MPQELVNVVSLGSIYLLFALGMSLVWGTIGILNFAHGAIFMFSAFTCHVLVRQVRLPMVALVAVGVAVGALLSVAAQVLVFGPIRRRAKDRRRAELQVLIGGIGAAAVPLALAQKETSSVPFGFTGSSFESTTYTVLGARVSTAQAVIIVLGLTIGLALTGWLRSSRTGLALRATGVDAETAALMGVDQSRLALAAMALAGGLAGLAGVLLTYNLGAISPESGDTLLIKAFAAVILGGVGSMLGAIVGSYLLALAETLVVVYTSGTWVDAVSFGVIFAVLLVKSEGLFGRAEVRRT